MKLLDSFLSYIVKIFDLLDLFEFNQHFKLFLIHLALHFLQSFTLLLSSLKLLS